MDSTAATAPVEGATRDLAYRWLAAVCEGGLNGPGTDALVTADFLLHLPRSTAMLTAGGGLDTPRSRFGAVMEAVHGHFDIRGTTVVNKKADIFGDDRGGIQYVLRLQPKAHPSFEVLTMLTFERRGDRLSAVRVHADTAMLLRGLAIAREDAVVS